MSEEPAFKAIEDERLREEIFSEYVYDLRKQEKANIMINLYYNIIYYIKTIQLLNYIKLN